ncbi:MAG: DUF1538 domain-containing protein [Eubacteriales bacterium]|nr:DUF1538 domain-containing protein [Eubacteriales bacterium]
MRILIDKLKETLYSVLPIVVIVLFMHLFVSPLSTDILWRFIIGAVFVTFGLTVFILGVDIGITPIGNLLGTHLTKSNRVWVLCLAGLLLGIIITLAEPSLLILANQVDTVTASAIQSFLIVAAVSLGTGIMLSVGLMRIVYSISLRKLFICFYGIVLILSIFSDTDFLAISFDASGATTGALAVPFILALASGSSRIEKTSEKKENDSFGLVGVASIGAILAVLIMGVLNDTGNLGGTIEFTQTNGVFAPFAQNFLPQLWEVIIVLLPILIVFWVGNRISFHLDAMNYYRIFVGIFFSTIGLVLFLLGVNQGFMQAGMMMGASLASAERNILLIVISFLLGVVTILAEPAVHILTRQIEEVTSAHVKARGIMVSLALGVGVAIVLAMLRIIVPGLQFWHIILPGYILAMILSRFAPNLFVGIAFDSGGVASGPMTATFVLAFIQGAANNHHSADVLLDGFGVIALVAMTPIIALQILGILFKMRERKAAKFALEEDF